ncbi:MAG: hypothetical protein ACU83P_10835, partial [Gammaproteobacteria bacterium]
MLKYILCEERNGELSTFSEWGTPTFVELDLDGYDEILLQFQGQHLTLPDVSVLRWKANHFFWFPSSGDCERIRPPDAYYGYLQISVTLSVMTVRRYQAIKRRKSNRMAIILPIWVGEHLAQNDVQKLMRLLILST